MFGGSGTSKRVDGTDGAAPAAGGGGGGGLSNPLAANLDGGGHSISNFASVEGTNVNAASANILSVNSNVLFSNKLNFGPVTAAKPITVTLPCDYSEFPNPDVSGLILTMNSTGRVIPVGDISGKTSSNMERVHVIGVSTGTVSPGQTTLEVAVGGIVEMTVYNQCEPGDFLERNNQGLRLVKGAVQAQVRDPNTGVPYNPGYGVCAQALTSSPGATDGSAKVLAILMQEQNAFLQDQNPN